MDFYGIATIVPITTAIQLLPQVFKSYQTKSVTLMIVLLNNVLWLIHGYFIFDYSLILSGLLSVAINSILILLYFIFKNNHHMASE